MQIVSQTICMLVSQTICMQCQSLFPGKNKNNISKCRLLKFLHSKLLSVKMWQPTTGRLEDMQRWETLLSYTAREMMRNVGKQHLCHLGTAKVEMSVRIHEAWSGHSLFINYCTTVSIDSVSRQQRPWSVCTYVQADQSVLSANCIRALFVPCPSKYFWLQLNSAASSEKMSFRIYESA